MPQRLLLSLPNGIRKSTESPNSLMSPARSRNCPPRLVRHTVLSITDRRDRRARHRRGAANCQRRKAGRDGLQLKHNQIGIRRRRRRVVNQNGVAVVGVGSAPKSCIAGTDVVGGEHPTVAQVHARRIIYRAHIGPAWIIGGGGGVPAPVPAGDDDREQRRALATSMRPKKATSSTSRYSWSPPLEKPAGRK